MAHYERVKHFRINLAARKKLGQGSQGTVYPGVNLTTGDPVAAKKTEGVYKVHFNKEEFEKEADFLLNKIPPHANIIKVYDFVKTEYENKGIQLLDLWLFTELCEFGNLKEFAFVNDLSIEKKIEIMYQSALAVRHLHGCKPESIAHRDVKPENILVTGTKENPIIKLCDFGSAKSVFRKSGKSVTMWSLAGTNKYQAPEQIELHDGHFKYDKQVDIFSLGITFLALLKAMKESLMSPETINENNREKGLGEIMWMKHKNQQTFTFSIHRSSDSALVRAVKDVIERMIKFEPSSRLSAEQVVAELSKLRTGYLATQPARATTSTPSAPTPVSQPAPATDTQPAPASVTQPAPATGTQPAPATGTQPTCATVTLLAPDTSTRTTPSTSTQTAPARNPLLGATAEAFLPSTRVVALYDLKGNDEEDLSFNADDVLTIIEIRNQNYYQAKDKNGKVGQIPINYVRRRREVKLHTIETWVPGTEVVALSDRNTENPEDLSFNTDAVLTITEILDENNYRARDKSGNTGKICSQHVRKRDVQSQPVSWYHRKMNDTQARRLLLGELVPADDNAPKRLSRRDVGTFLVHELYDEFKKSADHVYTLSMVDPDRRVGRYRIYQQGNKLTMDRDFFEGFEDIVQLVQYYEQNAILRGTCLREPLVSQACRTDLPRVCVHAEEFVKECWNISRSEIHIRDKIYTDDYTETFKGGYNGNHVFIRKRKEPCNVQDILTEAAIMSGLSHKNVVQLIGVVLGEETQIVTEYLGRGALCEYLCSHGPDTITSQEQINFARDICQGMRYLEEKQIVHRCLWSGSVLISGEGTAKVGDFITAHPVDRHAGLDVILDRWAAPEVTVGQPYTTKADMWSFGVVLWEIYSFGALPYPAISKGRDMYNHVVEGGRLEAPAGCPEEIYHVMSAAWDIDPTKRPTFSDACKTLDRIDVVDKADVSVPRNPISRAKKALMLHFGRGKKT